MRTDKAKRLELITQAVRTVETTDFHCPNCGKKEVWAELKQDGFKAPHNGIYGCIACHESWSMTPWIEPESELDTHLIAQRLMAPA